MNQHSHDSSRVILSQQHSQHLPEAAKQATNKLSSPQCLCTQPCFLHLFFRPTIYFSSHFLALVCGNTEQSKMLSSLLMLPNGMQLGGGNKENSCSLLLLILGWTPVNLSSRRREGSLSSGKGLCWAWQKNKDSTSCGETWQIDIFP